MTKNNRQRPTALLVERNLVAIRDDMGQTSVRSRLSIPMNSYPSIPIVQGALAICKPVIRAVREDI